MKKVVVTGSNGFIGKNLIEKLSQLKDYEIVPFDIDTKLSFEKAFDNAEFIYHLAGENRPKNIEDYKKVNVGLTQKIVDVLDNSKQSPTIVFTSSIQAELDNPYGLSKREAEEVLIKYNKKKKATIYIYRLPGVFGKWSRPNYNTVVATFCFNIARGLDIKISDPSHILELVYIEDVVSSFIDKLSTKGNFSFNRCTVNPVYKITLMDLAETIYEFKRKEKFLKLDDIPEGIKKCLYITYQSFLPGKNSNDEINSKE
ncbi:MAG: NAD-dependent epimerase/dehydratase family protein [Candidatus Methanofastidiosa archaeon]|nr:NAD-dependent epimerase/dehydratase family protein [Candidatus Methanofastidiosa archaeon]